MYTYTYNNCCYHTKDDDPLRKRHAAEKIVWRATRVWFLELIISKYLVCVCICIYIYTYIYIYTHISSGLCPPLAWAERKTTGGDLNDRSRTTVHEHTFTSRT